MIPSNDFKFPEKAKPFFGKKPFSLTLEQLSFLCLLSEKLHLTDSELKLVEYLTYNECKAISRNRFRELNYECVALASALYVFDLKNKDYSLILALIDSMYPGRPGLQAAGVKAKVYSIYNEFCNIYREVKLDSHLFKDKNGALKLKK